MSNGLTVVEYIRADGSNPYRVWFDSLHAQAAAKVATAVVRLELGNLSRVKWIGAIGEGSHRLGAGLPDLPRPGRRQAHRPARRWHQAAPADRHRAGENDVGRVQRTEGGSRKAARQGVNAMALTRDFRETIVERVGRDPEFAKALLDEAATLFLNGEADSARLVLRDLVNATVGFEALAAETARPAKSLHRMLSRNGNPTMDNLAAILGVVRKNLGVEIKAYTVEAA